MSKKLLMAASSLGHILSFHIPYLKAFHDMGWEVHVAGAGTQEIPHADEVISLGFEKSFFSPANFRVASQLRKLIGRNKYDLIICHTSLAAFFTRLACFGAKGKTKVINVMHGYLFDDDTSFIKGSVLKAAEMITAPVTDLVLTMNQWDHAWAMKHKAGKRVANILGMGIDERKLAQSGDAIDFGFADDDFVLVYPAEFSKRKNQSMLIRSLKLLPENVKLILPGRGALLDECKELAKTLGLGERIIFPGHVNDIYAVLKAADAAVSSSRSEGLPFNIMEAMLCGLPVIASDVKGNSDLVRHGENGLLYPFDDERSFTRDVEKLINSKELCDEMGVKGKSMVQNYCLSAVLHQVFESYLNIIS